MTGSIADHIDRIKAGLWDFDGVLYDIYSGFQKAAGESAVLAAIALGYKTDSFGRAVQQALDSYRQRGDCAEVFVDQGIDRAAFHSARHAFLSERVRNYPPGCFSPCARTVGLLEDCRSHVRHGILTASCAEYWACEKVRDLGWEPYIHRDAQGPVIIGMAEGGYRDKGKDPGPALLAAERLGVDPDGICFFEDTVRNLGPAKEIGMITCHVHYGRPKADLPAYVDFQIHSPREFLQALKACRHAPQARPAAAAPDFCYA